MLKYVLKKSIESVKSSLKKDTVTPLVDLHVDPKPKKNKPIQKIIVIPKNNYMM